MIKVAIIGLDTSHSVTYSRVVQGPDRKISGMRAVTCYRFPTPFTSCKVLSERSRQLDAMGVKVTDNLSEALEGCDAVMLEINDGSFHLEYFRKVAGLGKPVFLDKPLACSIADGRAIVRLARKHRTRVWSGSSIPFLPEVAHARASVDAVRLAHVYGPLGQAPAGDSLIWYGVHVFEMLQRLMGSGAEKVQAVENANGVVAVVDYGYGRQGVVEVIKKCGVFGGRVVGTRKGKDNFAHPFVADSSISKLMIMREVKKFFSGGAAPVDLSETLEGLAMMTAARRSIETGRPVSVPRNL